MIDNQDRSGYIGASDTSYVVGNWKTKSFQKWWLVKLGLAESDFTNSAMLAGTNYEHAIADSLGLEGEKDGQVIIEDLRLRVNYDFETDDTIYEIKTYNANKGFKVSKQYYRQAQVEMFARNWEKKLVIVAYGLNEDDYFNYFHDIDKKRLSMHPVKPDKKFIENEYLPKLNILKDFLIRGAIPYGTKI